ncbi:hypothetical protein Gasu2_37160 [Galdieria sulphuraria]|nr:hypothetical protein Gasu2_37160 [Galdieria sulphuraria]
MSSELEPETVYDMVVVHRENDVRVVTLQLFQLYTLRKLDRHFKPVIPFGPHLFGSGKTKFVQSYLELVNNMGESALIGLDYVYESEKANRRGFLEKLKRASLLYADLRRLKPTVPIEFFRNLKWAVYYLLIKAACSQVGAEIFRKIPSDQYLLIAFDEVGVLDESLDEFLFKRTHDGRVRPYNDFSVSLVNCAKNPTCFLLLLGKVKA